MYFESDTKLLEIQEGEVSGLYNIYNPSYTFSVSGNIGTLLLRLEPIQRSTSYSLPQRPVDTAIIQIHTLTFSVQVPSI